MGTKKIAILGSTGSIGKQTIEIIKTFPDKYEVEVLVCFNNYALLIEQAKDVLPDRVVIANREHYGIVKDALKDIPVKVYTGKESVSQVCQSESIDIFVMAIVGYSALAPMLEAVKSGKRIALANKESLVVAGEIIEELAIKYKTEIIPVDSEHSAIFQSLVGEKSPVSKLILTASGGPFFNKDIDFNLVTKEQALAHPNWNMGAKITIDSATMMNKGLEVIEAKWLFNMPISNIEVTIHPQSIVHSMVEFTDGAVKAQLGVPSMLVPIQYALSFPYREVNDNIGRLNFKEFAQLTFYPPDPKFECLSLAYDSIKEGGVYPLVLNASNEIAVELFLGDKIRFSDIPKIIKESLNQRYSNFDSKDIDSLIKLDSIIRKEIYTKYC